MNWIKVEPNPKDNDAHPELLPPMEKVVHVIYVNEIGGPPVIALGGRVDGEEGWLWAINDNAHGHEKDDKWHDLNADDEYLVTHWAEIEWPE